MKFNVLRSIGHNIAYSLASGESMLIGNFQLRPFKEAGQSPNGFIHVNFLTGTSSAGSLPFRRAIISFRKALPELCEKHGASLLVFRRLEAGYVFDAMPNRFFVTIEDQEGRSTTDEYAALGQRFRVLDPLGRIRRKRSPVIQVSQGNSTR